MTSNTDLIYRTYNGNTYISGPTNQFSLVFNDEELGIYSPNSRISVEDGYAEMVTDNCRITLGDDVIDIYHHLYHHGPTATISTLYVDNITAGNLFINDKDLSQAVTNDQLFDKYQTPSVYTENATGGVTIPIANIIGKIYEHQVTTSGQTDTLFSAAQLVGAMYQYSINSTYMVITTYYANTGSQNITLAPGAGGTLRGNTYRLTFIITDVTTSSEGYTVIVE